MSKITPDKSAQQLINNGLATIIMKELREKLVNSETIYKINERENLLTFTILTICVENHHKSNLNKSIHLNESLADVCIQTLKHSIKDNYNVSNFIKNKSLQDTLIELYKHQKTMTLDVVNAVKFLTQIYPNIMSDVKTSSVDIVYFLDNLIDKPSFILEDNVSIEHLYPSLEKST